VTLYLVDLSAWARASHRDARARWAALLDGDRLLCHPVFAIELLHNAIGPSEFQRMRNDLEQAFDWRWPDEETARIALRMQHRMATSAPSGQRVKTADVLIAALAAQNGVGVLHYDADYDVIGERAGEPFDSEWLCERSALESATQAAATSRKAYRKAFGERMVQLQDDGDLEVWPELIAWLDQQLTVRGLDPPPAPSA
jgi:predicted nucleic acid-binding protein